MQTARKTALGKLRKARENVASLGSRPPAAPAAQPAKPAVNLKALDQRPRRRNVEHRLGDEGARQRRAILLRTPYTAAEIGGEHVLLLPI